MKAGWKTVKLGDVTKEFIVPQRDKPKNLCGDIPWCRIEDIDGIYMSSSKSGKGVTAKDVKEMPLRIFPAGTVIVSCSADLGRCAIVSKPLITNQTFLGIVPDETIDAKYLYYLLRSRAEQLNSMATGATIKYLSRDKFSSLEIPLPPLAEQKRIAALLDEAFVGIDTLSSNAKTRSSEALYVFEQERDSFFSNPDNKYTETTISDITTRLQYGTSEKSASTGRYVVLRMGNIQDGEIDYEDLKYTSSQEVIDQYSLKPGDVLFNRTNSPQWVGKSAIYRGEMPAVFAGYNIKIHTIADKVDSEFLTFFLNSDRAMSFGRATFISSVNQANINAEKLRSYRLPLPPLREQKAIADRLGQIRKMSRELAAIYQNSLAQSHHLKAATLRSAFNGTL